MRSPQDTSRNSRPRLRYSVVVIVFALVGLVVPANSAGAATGDYVALGDSYAAGPLIPDQEVTPLGCLRSTKNYAHLLSPQLGLSRTDVTCSGADTDDMLNAQGVTPGPNPPQFNALKSTTRVVTLQIGGNDVGFSSIVTGCVAITPWGPTCKGKYVVNGVDTLTAKIINAGPKVSAAIQGIHARSPQAKVFVLGYPTILPDSGNGCWPALPLANSDVPYLRSIAKALNFMIALAAAMNGAYYVDIYTPSIGHDACKGSGTKWVEGVLPSSVAAPVHPNANGMAAFANIVKARIQAVGY